MKKGLFVLLAIVLVATNATFAVAASWEIGFRGGWNVTKLGGDDINQLVNFSDPALGSITGDLDNFKNGFVGGAFAQANLTDVFGLQFGAQIAQRGGDGKINVSIDLGPPFGLVQVEGDVALKLTYFEIPILGVFSFPTGNAASFRVMGGPMVAFKTGSKLELSAEGQSESEDIDEIKGFDFAGVVGAGLSFGVGAVNLLIDGQWVFGFTSIDDGLLGTGSDLSVKNNGFGIMAGVSIPVPTGP